MFLTVYFFGFQSWPYQNDFLKMTLSVVCSWSVPSLSLSKGKSNHELDQASFSQCPVHHSFVLCCANTCPHPSPLPAAPKEHSVPIIFLERRRSILLVECVLHTTRFGNIFCQDMHRLSHPEYFYNKPSPHLARFYLGLRGIQVCQVLCRVLVGAVFLAPSY